MGKAFKYIIQYFFIACFSVHVQGQTIDTTVYYDSGSVAVSPTLQDVAVTQNFDSLITDDANKVQTRTADRAALKKMREDDDFWYYNTAPPEKKIIQKKKVQPSTSGPWLSYLLWTIVIGGFLAFLIWFLMTSNVQLFKKSSKRITTNTDEQETEDIFDINYDSKIAAAINAKNYRLAIRLMYLQLLTKLSENGLINYQQQKTNSDYVMQLYGTGYYQPFFRITRQFEYTWYGLFPLSDSAFKPMKEEFDGFNKMLQG